MTLFKETHWLTSCRKRTIYFQVFTGKCNTALENVMFHCLVAENGDRDPRFISFKVSHSTSWVLHTFTSHMLRQDPIIFSFHTLSKTFRRYNSLIFHGCKPQFQRQFASFVYIVIVAPPQNRSRQSSLALRACVSERRECHSVSQVSPARHVLHAIGMQQSISEWRYGSSRLAPLFSLSMDSHLVLVLWKELQ